MVSSQHGIPGIVVLMFFNGPLACSPRSCEDAQGEYHGYLIDCGVDFSFDNSDENPCDDIHRQLYECYSSCLKGASCEALNGGESASDEAGEVYACQNYCSNFVADALGSVETEQ